MVDCIRGVGTVAVRVCREETKPEEVGPALALKPGGGTAGLKPEAGGHPVVLGAGRRSLCASMRLFIIAAMLSNLLVRLSICR